MKPAWEEYADYEKYDSTYDGIPSPYEKESCEEPSNEQLDLFNFFNSMSSIENNKFVDTMTNFGVLMSCSSPEQFLRMYEQEFGSGCMQNIGKYRDVWKKHCLQPEYRGKNGCKRCKIEFWNSEYAEVTNEKL